MSEMTVIQAELFQFSDDNIKAQIKVLNDDFKNTGISWVLVNTTRIHNPDWFVHSGPGTYVGHSTFNLIDSLSPARFQPSGT